MHHAIGIAGGAVGLAGTIALSIDLLRSKMIEESGAKYENAQEKIHAGFQELTVNTLDGLRDLATIIKGTIAAMKLDDDADARRAVAAPNATTEADAFQKTSASLVDKMFAEFPKAADKLPDHAAVQKALDKIAQFRAEGDRAFAEAGAHARRMRRVAAAGVWLVGIGAVAQLIDLILNP